MKPPKKLIHAEFVLNMFLRIWQTALKANAKLARRQPWVNAILIAFSILYFSEPRPNKMPMTKACANRSLDPYLKPCVAPFMED